MPTILIGRSRPKSATASLRGGIFSAVDEHYFPYANRENDYQIDRELQKQGNFTGIRGISEQDAAIADSQGLIADRTRELLGQTDLGVVRFRRMMLDAARTIGQQSPHDSTAPAAYNIRQETPCPAPTRH